MKRRVRSALGRLLGLILTPAFALAWLLRRASSGNTDGAPRSVLLVRFDLMGDIVNALAAAHAARRRWPDAQVTFLAPSRWRAILQRCSAVDVVLPFDFGALTHWPGCLDFRMWRAAWRLLRRIRSRRFDLAVSIYGPIAGTVVACSGALVRLGYAAEAPGFSFDRALPGRRRNGGPHESVLAARLLGVEAAEWHTLDRTADLPLPDRVAKAESPLIVAHPGAARGLAKRWPDEHWLQALRDLRERTGAGIVVVGLESDRALAQRLARQIDGLIDLTGRTTLEELMAVLRAAGLVISTDSGPAHLTRALGTRVIALHGPTDVSIHGPGDPNSVALRVDIPCGPCYMFRGPAECAYGDVLCMHWLAPARVVAKAIEMLDQTEPARA